MRRHSSPDDSYDYDLAVVGGGAAGLGAARAGRRAGARVVLISDGPIGGDCTFTGCVPSKALLSAARDGLRFGDALNRVHGAVARIAATEDADALAREGIAVISGRARLETTNLIEVGGRHVSARRIVVATGSRPRVPAIKGLDSVGYLTNETLFSLTAQPESLAILGGGPVGCEMAQAFARLGTKVTLFHSHDRLLNREEPDASTVVAQALGRDGVDVVFAAEVSRVESTSSGQISVRSKRGDFAADQVLVATGRIPNIDGLGLADVGVTTRRDGFVEADAHLRTSVESVYAAGDVVGGLFLSHAADEMGRLAAGHALGKGQRSKYQTKWIPWCTFTDPEVARIGYTEAQAAGHGGRVAYLPLDEVDRAITDGRTEGYIKLIAGPRVASRRVFGGRIIGATIVAPRAGEMIAEVALAMRAGMFPARIAQAVHAYPSWSSGVQKAAAQFVIEIEGRKARKAVKER